MEEVKELDRLSAQQKSAQITLPTVSPKKVPFTEKHTSKKFDFSEEPVNKQKPPSEQA